MLLHLSEEERAGFSIEEIAADGVVFSRMKGKSYKEDCPLALDQLRYLRVLHRDFEGKRQCGELVCNVHIAEKLIAIFMRLYAAGYQIEKLRLIDEYDADDERSMSDNNSSSFNFRFISYTKILSNHGLGLAIDINPRYNPYVKEVEGRLSIEPANGAAFVERSKAFAHKIDENDLCYRLFLEYGFEWGGAWTESKDYQHFQLPEAEIHALYKETGLI